MNLSKQIKKHRERLSLSQEGLAEKLYVSRQTISNWENEKSYPDVHNLLLLSVLFDVSLDVHFFKQILVHNGRDAVGHYNVLEVVFSDIATVRQQLPDAVVSELVGVASV